MQLKLRRLMANMENSDNLNILYFSSLCPLSQATPCPSCSADQIALRIVPAGLLACIFVIRAGAWAVKGGHISNPQNSSSTTSPSISGP